MPRYSLVRVARFRATHHYERLDGPAGRNPAALGPLGDPHPHDYRVEVTVTGVPEPQTGFVVDLALLDEEIAREVVAPLDGSDLNQALESVRSGDAQPCTEILAGWIWSRLASRIPGEAVLAGVRVWEDEELAGEAAAG